MLNAPIPLGRMFWGRGVQRGWSLNSQLLKTLPLFLVLVASSVPLFFISSSFATLLFLLSGFSSRIETRVARKASFQRRQQEAMPGDPAFKNRVTIGKSHCSQAPLSSSSAERQASADGLAGAYALEARHLFFWIPWMMHYLGLGLSQGVLEASETWKLRVPVLVMY